MVALAILFREMSSDTAESRSAGIVTQLNDTTIGVDWQES